MRKLLVRPVLAGRRIAPLLFFLLGALLFSWPLALYISDRVIATGSGDIWQHLWNIWWARFSLLELHSLPCDYSTVAKAAWLLPIGYGE